jgi:hypothetical protein
MGLELERGLKLFDGLNSKEIERDMGLELKRGLKLFDGLKWKEI